jgi:cytochrome bd ubiquinol oxidase subunit II
MNPLDLFDYGTLRMIWWVLLGILLIGFALTDGFDLGSLILLPFVARKDGERRIVVNAIGPVWEGNQVWLILGAGAIFAAWPMVYATAFSGFYPAMIIALAGLVLRPVAIIYRSKMQARAWRAIFDGLMVIASFVPALIFGVAIGNVIEGAPFRFDPSSMRLIYQGSFIDLLNPFALLTGLLSVCMITMHGGAYLALKTEEVVAFRARIAGFISALLVMALFVAAGVWVALAIKGYLLLSPALPDGESNPLAKLVSRSNGAWFANYGAAHWLMAAPAMGFFGAALAATAFARGRDRMALITSGIAVFGIIATVGVSMFPFILPSSLDPRSSLTLWDASSSKATLLTMLAATAIFLPLILIYTTIIYRVLRGRVSGADVEADHGSY